jgi:hypothetical protein
MPLPNTVEAGRDFFQYMVVLSLARNFADKKMRHALETMVPWMQQEEADRMVEHIESLPIFERATTTRELGQQLQVTNEERERLGLTQMKPIDMSDEQLAEQRRNKNNARRRAKHGRSREQYLAEMASRPKPWIAAGLTRSQWYRRKRDEVPTQMGRGTDATIFTKQRPNLVSSRRGESQQEGLQGSVATGRPVEVTKVERVEREEKDASHGLRRHLVSPADELARVRAERETLNLERWRNRHEQKNSA